MNSKGLRESLGQDETHVRLATKIAQEFDTTGEVSLLMSIAPVCPKVEVSRK